MVRISNLLRQFDALGVELVPQAFSLPAPRWPDPSPSDLRESFTRHRRALMSRVAPPVFVHIETHSSDPSLQNSSRQILHEVAHDTMVMALIDEELIIWLPGLNAECVDSIRWQLSLRQGGLDLGSAQIVNDRIPPPILRRAAKSGRAFCVWSDRSQHADAWRTLGISPPSRWIELLDLARAGGWPEDFSALMWNVLSIRPPQGLLPQYQVSHPQAHSSPIEYWTTRIRAAGNQLLGVADLYDPLRQHDEPDLLETHHAINKRGIRLDVELARDVLCLAREYAESQFSTIAATTQGTMSTSQLLDDRYVLSWLQSWGIPLTRLDAKSIRGLLNETRSQNVRFSASAESVLHARLTLAEQPIGSLWRALELVNPRQRICGHMEYYSSRSGEFSSPGIAFGQLMTMAYFSNSPWRTSYFRFPCLDQVRSRLPRGSSVDDILASMVTDCLIPADDHLFTVCRWRFLSKAILRWLVSHHSQREHHSGLTQSEDCRQLLVEQLRDALAHEQHAEFCHCQLEISSDAIQVRLPSGRSLFFRNIRAFDVDDFPRGGDGHSPSPAAASTRRNLPDPQTILNDIVGAIARDVLATALLRCVDLDLPVVAHGSDFVVIEHLADCHDRVITSVNKSVCAVPDWAEGLSCTVNCTSGMLAYGVPWVRE